MFCGKCGVKNSDDSKFCSECGTPLRNDQINKISTFTTNPNDKNRKIGIIAVAIVVIAVAIMVLSLLGGRSYKATIDQYINAQFDVDAEAIIELFPEEMLDYILEEEGYDNDELDEFIDEGNDELQDMLDYLERYLGKGYEVSYDILSVKNVTGDDFDDLKDDYKDIDVKVSAAKTIEVELTVKSGATESSNTVDVPVIKIGRSWYLDIASMGSIF